MRTRKQLAEAQAQIVQRLDALDAEIGENQQTDAQTAELDKLHADLEAIKGELAQLDAAAEDARKRRERLSEARAFNINTGSTGPARELHAGTSADELTFRSNRAIRAWAMPDAFASEEAAEDAKAFGIRIGSRELDLRLGQAPKTIEDAKKLSMGVSQIGTGGAIVAPSFVSAIEVAALAFGGIRGVANVMRTETSAEIPYPTVNDTSNKATIVAEIATPSRTTVTMGRVIIRAHKYATGLVPVSRELLRDAATDIGALIGRLLGERIFRGQAEHFCTGIGTTQPMGLLTAGTLGVTAAATSAITANEVIQLTESLDPAYSANAVLVMNRATRSALRQLTAGTGEYLWGKDVATGAPQTFNGVPVRIDENMPNIATGLKPIAFGDMSKYLIRDVGTIRMQRFTELLGESDADGFTAFMESDGNLLDAGTHPVKYLQMA